MPKFVIEREVPGVGNSSKEDLAGMSKKSCDILRVMGPEIQWVHSYVTGDKIYCVYISPDEKTILEHAEKGGFPANKISKIYDTLDPTTAEA